MSGTKAGGIKARQTNLERHGSDFYVNIGKKGGMCGSTGGFASDKVGKDGLTGKERAKMAGRKGGRLSKRGKGYDVIWERVKESVMQAREDGHSFKEISEAVGIPYGSLIKRVTYYKNREIGERRK